MSILNEDNYRYELKFLLTKKKAEVLKYRLSLIMDKDNYSLNSNGEYYIRSLYYDDVFNTAYYEKLNGYYEREKYRIRYYNLDDTFITLELKGKKGDVSYKQRSIISKEEYLLINSGDYDKIDVGNRELLREFIDAVKFKNLKPSIIVDYTRIAYTYPYEDVRITFDEDVMSGKYNYDLLSNDIDFYSVLDNDNVILEVKYNNKLPSFLNDVIKTVPMVRIAVSKFALCTERKYLV